MPFLSTVLVLVSVAFLGPLALAAEGLAAGGVVLAVGVAVAVSVPVSAVPFTAPTGGGVDASSRRRSSAAEAVGGESAGGF